MGKTIIISSHILHELAELCTTVGIIEQGELLFHGTLEEILRRAKTATRLHISVTEQIDLAALLLERTRGIKSVEQRDGRLLVELEKQTHDFSPIARLLLKNNFKIREIKEEEVNLETAFMRLTKGMVQ
jgi:ABC-2 type transport system ATP-binding protein